MEPATSTPATPATPVIKLQDLTKVFATECELYESGATICMVTHDPRYARHANRNIHLFDGRVVTEPNEPMDVAHLC